VRPKNFLLFSSFRGDSAILLAMKGVGLGAHQVAFRTDGFGVRTKGAVIQFPTDERRLVRSKPRAATWPEIGLPRLLREKTTLNFIQLIASMQKI
jgi:hypothetical protein